MYKFEPLRKCLLDAAADGDLERLLMLLERDDFDKKLMMSAGPFRTTVTPIHVAVVRGHSHIVEAIVKYYTEATSHEAGFPMLAACKKESTDCIRIIFKSLPHLRDTMDVLGYHLIHIAASSGSNDIVEVLLELGVDVNQTTWSHDDGSACKTYRHTRKTALDIASDGGWQDVVETLLKHGADPLKPSSEGYQLRSALSPAASNGHFKILQILSQVIPLDQAYGSHAVWSAVVGMKLTCLQYLLDNGATFNLEDEDRIRRAWRVIINSHPTPDCEIIRMTEILLENGVPMNPLADERFLLPLSEFMTKPRLKFLIASGLFEMMYSKVYPTLDSNHCEKFSSKFFRLFSESCYPSDDRHKDIQYTADKLRSVIPYLPYSFISAQRYFDKEFIDYHFREEKKFPSLQELCRWKIRCQIVSKEGYISQKLLSKLGLPKPLQEYLFDKVSHNLNWRLRVEDQESLSSFSSNAAGHITDWDVYLFRSRRTSDWVLQTVNSQS